MANNIVSRIGIKNADGVGYDTKEIGAKAQNIVVGVNDNGDIIKDVDTEEPNTTESLSLVLSEMQKPHDWADGGRDMGKASKTKYGHVKIGDGLKIENGIVTPDFGTGENQVCKGNDARLSDKRLTLNPLIIGGNRWNGDAELKVTPALIGAAPTNHVSTVATTSNFGHVKIGTGIGTNLDGQIEVLYGRNSGTACAGNDLRLSDYRTPKPHANADGNNFGIGTSELYGHVKLYDTYDYANPNIAINGSNTGIAASSFALQSAFKRLNEKIGLHTETYTRLTDRIYTGRDTLIAQITISKPGHYLIVYGYSGGGGSTVYIRSKIYTATENRWPAYAINCPVYDNNWEASSSFTIGVGNEGVTLKLFGAYGYQPSDSPTRPLDLVIYGMRFAAYRIGD